jgi:hypothetical protein
VVVEVPFKMRQDELNNKKPSAQAVQVSLSDRQVTQFGSRQVPFNRICEELNFTQVEFSFTNPEAQKVQVTLSVRHCSQLTSWHTP